MNIRTGSQTVWRYPSKGEFPKARGEVLFAYLIPQSGTIVYGFGYKDDDDPETRLWFDLTNSDRDGEPGDTYDVVAWLEILEGPKYELRKREVSGAWEVATLGVV